MHEPSAICKMCGGKDGFLLIELVIAIAVFAVGIAGVITSYNFAMDKLRVLKESGIADRVVQDEIERLRALPFEQLADCENTPIAVTNPEFEELAYAEATATVAPADAPGLALKRVHVLVSWRGDAGRITHRSADTLIAKRAAGEGTK